MCIFVNVCLQIRKLKLINLPRSHLKSYFQIRAYFNYNPIFFFYYTKTRSRMSNNSSGWCIINGYVINLGLTLGENVLRPADK